MRNSRMNDYFVPFIVNNNDLNIQSFMCLHLKPKYFARLIYDSILEFRINEKMPYISNRKVTNNTYVTCTSKLTLNYNPIRPVNSTRLLLSIPNEVYFQYAIGINAGAIVLHHAL